MEWIISDPAYLSTMLAAKPVLLALRQTYSKLLEKLKFIRRFYLVTEVQAPPSIALRGALGNASVSADVLAAKSQLLPVVMFIIKCIIVAVLGSFATCVLPFFLDEFGFGRHGVRPKTVAAWWQAKYKGSIPKNGPFAILQKWGMAGLPGSVSLCTFVLVGYMAWCIF
ncbi:hypothetical protein MRX96_001208 [Rhipicephalus microplus]